MQIVNALDITALVNQSGRCAKSFPLVSLEELFVMHGLEDGSFGIFRSTKSRTRLETRHCSTCAFQLELTFVNISTKEQYHANNH